LLRFQALGGDFGPLPLLSKRVRYADITGVEIGHTDIIHGWGIH